MYLFIQPRTEAFLVGLEAQGWFTATSYKGQQGQRVRRGTILAILLMAGSGVYTMMNNGFLRRLPQSLYLNIPFTGTAPVLDLGDAGRAGLIKKLPEKDKDKVQIVAHGASAFKDGAVVSPRTSATPSRRASKRPPSWIRRPRLNSRRKWTTRKKRMSPTC